MCITIQALVSSLEYQRSRAHIFPSIESLRWYIRCNKIALTDAGAVLEITGRLRVSPEAFDGVVVAVGMYAAKRDPIHSDCGDQFNAKP